LILGTNSDFVLSQGTLAWGANDFRSRRISFTIPNDNLVEFNEDFHVFIYRIVNSAPVLVGTVNDASVTILFDDQDAPAGSVDENYNADFGVEMAPPVNTNPPNQPHPGTDGEVRSLVAQPDGKTIIGGDFLSYNSTPRRGVARINLDGTVDTTFNPGQGADDFVSAMALTPSGQLMVGGGFTSFNGNLRSRIVRLNANGSLDFGFNPGLGANDAVRALALQADGKIIIAGDFSSYNNVARSHIARLNTDGSLDASFNPGASGPNTNIYALAIQGDGKIILGGEFTTVNGQTLGGIARLNSDGSLDSAFTPGVGTDGVVQTLALRPDGKIWIGGEFSTINLTPIIRFARLNSDGTLDTSFDPGTSADATVFNIAINADGSVYVGGEFTRFNGTHRMGFVRLFSDGTVDTGFLDTAYNQFAGLHRRRLSDPPSAVFASAVQPDGNVLIGGFFGQVGGGQANTHIHSDPNDPPDTYDLDVWTEPKARDGIRNRGNVARLLGGSTPGPGNVGLMYNSYSASESQGSLSVGIVRVNGTLGTASANFGIGDGLAQSGVDYVYDNVPPLYSSSWNLTNNSSVNLALTRMHSDGLFGTNTVPMDIYGHLWFNYTVGRVDVKINNDTLIQGDRAATFQLANPSLADQFYLGSENIPLGVALGRATAPFAVVDDDHLPGVLGFAATNFFVNENAGTATITITRTNGSYGTETVAWQTYVTTTNGIAATPGSDYTAKNGSLTFANNEISKTFTVSIINDSTAEDDEVIGLRLFNPGIGTLLGLTKATLTILDNDSPNGRVNLSAPTYSTNENAGAVVVTVNRSGGSQGTLVVRAVTEDGTAISGIHYSGVTNVLTWNPTDTTPRTVTVPLIDNQLVEANHTFNVKLVTPTVNGVTNLNVLGTYSNAVVTIIENDAYGTVAFSQSTYNVMENGGPATITVNRSQGIAQSVTVNFATTGGTASQGSDYTPTNGILVFAPGEVSKSFNVAIVDNPFPDNARFIGLTISNSSPAGLIGFPNTAVLNITDDESVNQPPGGGDTGYDPTGGFNGDVHAIALQGDGKAVVAGDFTIANGVFRNRIARLNFDGTLDTVFSSAFLGANNSVRSLAVQTDGRVLASGFFTRMNGINQGRISRLNTDGSLDTSFNVGSGADNTVYAVAEAWSGSARKILLGGAFTTLAGIAHPYFGRLNNDGTVDGAFATGLGPNGTVYAIAAYPTNSVRAGQTLIGGDFTSINGTTRNHIARLNSDGSLDPSFSPPSGANDSIRSLAIQADERILAGGLFTNFNGGTFNHIARLNANGTTDNTFNAGVGADDVVSAITLQADNRIVVAGQFTRFNGVTRHRVTRLNPDGSTDTMINFGTGADNFIDAAVVQTDGNFILGGGFTHYDDQPHPHLVRVYGGAISGSGSFEFSSPTYQADETATNVTVTVRRNGGTSGAPSGDVFVTFATSDQTAVAGSNYVAVVTNLAFAPGEVLRTVTIPLIHDFQITPDLTVTLDLSNPQPPGGPSLGGQAEAVLTIINDDSGVAFSAPTYVRSENAPDGQATITLVRSGSVRGPAAVDFMTTTNGTALLNTNYLAVSNTVVFTSNQVSATVLVPVLHDFRAQGDTTVIMQLTNAVGTLLFTPATAVLTIVDVEHFPGQLLFAQTNYVVNEGDGFLPVTILRTNGRSGVVSVNFSTVQGTALPGLKYATTNGALTFADGETSKTFNVPIVDNSTVEPNQTFSLVLSNALGGATITGPANVPVTIVDNDPAVSFSSPAYVVAETAGSIFLNVLRPNGTNGTTSVNYATTNLTAQAGTNYVAASGTLVFTNGETIKSLNIQILHDPRVTGDLTFGVNLSNPSFPAQLLSPFSAVVVIQDSEPGFLFTNSVFSAVKSGTNALITVLRTNANTGLATVAYRTADGTAINGVDYVSTSGILTFSNGIAYQSFTVPLINNRLAAGDRAFTVALTNPTPVGVAQLVIPYIASVVITDDISGLSFSSGSYNIDENGGSALITVNRTGFTNSTVSVDYTTANGSALPGVNYTPASGTFTFTNGEMTKTFSVPVIDNGLADGDKTVLLSLSNPIGNAVLVPPSAATLTIRDIDGSLVIPAGSALSTESGPVNGVIDPNEQVTILLALRNASGTNTANLTATLLSGNGVSSPSGPQNYGALPVHGPSAFRPFSFTATGTNGQQISMVLQLRDGSTVLSNAVFNFTLGNLATVFSNSAAITINDFTNATPYPSVINVSGLGGILTKATATLTNLSHSWPSDVDILLVSPTGQKSYLMAKTGGANSINHVTLTFDDSGPALGSGLITSGTYRPTSLASSTPPFPVPAPPGPYNTNLTSFNGSNPNGAWSLFVYDDSQLNSGIISNGWSLSLNAGAIAMADLGITMTAPQTNNLIVTSNLTYTINVVNYGPSASGNVSVQDVLPVGANYISASSSQGSTLTNASGLTWSVGPMAVNASATLTLTVQPQNIGSITNLATVSAVGSSDVNPEDNSASVVAGVVNATADLVLGMIGAPNPVLLGSNVTYTLTVTNLGPATATSVSLTNTLPPGVSLVSASPAGYTISGRVVTFANLGNIGSGGQSSVTIVAKPSAAGEITNSAVTASTLTDPLKGNNLASVKVVVQAMQLGVSRSGNTLTLTWPNTFGTFNLETATNLVPPITWVTATNVPLTIGGQNSVTISIGSGGKFFRLHSSP
jgi:uncharacterized delta-60 repeat protein/uncharacterized repeat protein (TIGR01451 family)